MERPDPNYLRLLTIEELCELATQRDMYDSVLAELSRRNGAHTASARQSKKQRRKDEQLERQIKLREQTNATVISIPSADGSLPPGHKCAHGVYIPATSRYRERARYCSICHPYIILRYSKLRPVILRRSKFVWWSPNAATVKNISDSRPPFRALHWTGEPRPHGARRVPLRSNFPALPYLTYLVSELGYNGNAAFAAMVQAHQPWLRSVGRRRANPVDADAQAWTKAHGYSPHVSMHPYCPAAPGRRTKTGGGWTKQQVQHVLNKKRWDSKMKKAVFEIVYRRRMTREVSDELGLPVRTLYVYASRLRQDMQRIVKDLSKVEKARAEEDTDLHTEENIT